jgi:ferredoxin
VAPWVQWRGLVVLALLVVGNLFCMACPFMLPRRLAKRLLPGDRAWPVRLKGKWIALGLLVFFFWAYEALDLWDSPWLTAWVVVAYFAAAFVIDGFFKGAAFCKYACPIGSFNFVNSLGSPAEVRVRNADVCAACETKDCIAGRYREGRLVQSGCELWLYQPRKVGNLDCTFCLDCVQACPHENVGIIPRVPGRELLNDARRSGIGPLSRRPDFLALAMVVVFAAFVNAAGMIAPMQRVQEAMGLALGTGSDVVIWSAFLLLALAVVPAALLAGTALLSRWLVGGGVSGRRILLRMAWGLVPLGFGMWIAHYAFHFLAGGLNLVPVLQRAAADVGIPLGSPDWTLGALVPAAWLIPLELLLIEAGLLGSIVLSYYIARSTVSGTRPARRLFLPWAALTVALGLVGGWIMTQPMAMRGMMMPGTEMPDMEMRGLEMPGMDASGPHGTHPEERSDG